MTPLSSPPEPPESKPGDDQRPWLVMLYLAGDNNLTEEMIAALQDLRGGATPAGDRIVAQLDPSAMGIATQRYDFGRRVKGDGTQDRAFP